MFYYKNKKTGSIVSYNPIIDEVQEFELIGGGREVIEKADSLEEEIKIKVTKKRGKQKTVKNKIKGNKKGWSRKYDKCQGCGTTDIPHASRGLCRKCFDKKKNYKAKGKRGRKPNVEREYSCEDCQLDFTSSLQKIDVVCPDCKSINIR